MKSIRQEPSSKLLRLIGNKSPAVNESFEADEGIAISVAFPSLIISSLISFSLCWSCKTGICCDCKPIRINTPLRHKIYCLSIFEQMNLCFVFRSIKHQRNHRIGKSWAIKAGELIFLWLMEVFVFKEFLRLFVEIKRLYVYQLNWEFFQSG